MVASWWVAFSGETSCLAVWPTLESPLCPMELHYPNTDSANWSAFSILMKVPTFTNNRQLLKCIFKPTSILPLCFTEKTKPISYKQAKLFFGLTQPSLLGCVIRHFPDVRIRKERGLVPPGFDTLFSTICLPHWNCIKPHCNALEL